MNFPYSSLISSIAGRDEYLVLRRPEIPITIVGPAGSASYIGLVDTGSDQTILPMSVSKRLGIPVYGDPTPPASVFGGHRVQLHEGSVVLELSADGKALRWTAMVTFFEFSSSDEETVILGHAGFLDYFTATFDGQQGILTLLPNDDLPTTEN